MSFMQIEVLPRQAGACVDTLHGIFYVPSQVYGPIQLVAPPRIACQTLRDYVPHAFCAGDVEPVTGYFGRYSAPGYLDCTDWSFNVSREKLYAELAEMFGEDDGAD